MENKFIIEDATPRFVIEDANDDAVEMDPSTYGIKEEQPVEEKKENGVVKKDAVAPPKKNMASKPATTSSALQKPNKPTYTKESVANAVNKPIQTDFSALGGPSTDKFTFKEEGKTPETKLAEVKKAKVEKEYQDVDEAKSRERFRQARINHYKSNKQWKADSDLQDKLNTVDDTKIEEEVANEKDTHQLGDYAMDVLHAGGNILGGLLWTTPNNMLGKPFRDYEPYKIGEAKKAFDDQEDEANDIIAQKRKEAEKANEVWVEPTEEDKIKLKEDLFRQSAKQRLIEKNYTDAYATGISGGFSDYDKKMLDTQERLKLRQIDEIEGASDKQKINTFKAQIKGSIVDNLHKDLLHDKALIDSNKATDEIKANYNSKIALHNKSLLDYAKALEDNSKLEQDKTTATDRLKLYKLNYNTWSKLHSDIVSPAEEALGGLTKAIKYVDPFAAATAYIDGTENYWDAASKKLMEAAEENMSNHYQYSLDKVHSISDFGGYMAQNLGGLLPYIAAPEGALTTGAFMASAAGKSLYGMEREEEANPNIKYNPLQKAGKAMFAAAGEGLMLGAVNKLMKGTAPVLDKVFAEPLEKELLEKGMKEHVKNVLNKFPKDYFNQVNHAGLTGATVAGINTMADNLILGKKTDAVKNMVDGYANMAIVGAGIAAFPTVWGYGIGKLSRTADLKATEKNNAEIVKTEALLNDPNLSASSKNILKQKVNGLKQSNADIFQKGVDKLGFFTKPQIKDLFDIDQNKIEIKDKYKKIKEDKDADSEGNKEALKDLERQWSELENQKSKIFEKHNSLDYINNQAKLDALEVKAKKSLEQDNANPNTPNIKISEESIKDRMAQMHLIESKMVDNYGQEDFNDLYDKSFKELQNKVTNKQKEEGFAISDFDILKATQKKAIDRNNFYNSLEGAYTADGYKEIFNLSEKRKDLETQIKNATKEGEPTKELRSELETTVNDILNKTNVGKENLVTMRKEWKNLTKIERQILAVKHLTKNDIRNGNFKDHIGDNTAVQSFATTEEYQAVYDAYRDKMGLPRIDVSENDAEFMDNGQILINTEVAKRTGQINAAGHELLHKVLQGAFAYNPEVIKAELTKKVQYGEMTIEEARKKVAQDVAIHDERIDDLVESFKTAMGKEAREVVQKRIDKNYKYKTYSKKEFQDLQESNDPSIDDVMEVVDLGNGLVRTEINPSSYRQEWLTGFSDAIARKQIKDGFIITEDGKAKINWKKIGEALKSFVKKETDLDLEFKNGDDIVNFIKDYNKNLTKTRISNRAQGMIDAGIALGLNKGGSAKSKSIDDRIAKLEDQLMNNYIDIDEYNEAVDKLYEEEAAGVVAERPIAEKVKGEESVRTKRDVTVDEQRLGKEIDNLVGPKDAAGNYTMTKDQWDKGGILKAKEKLIDGTILEPIIRKELTRHGVSTDNVHGVPIDVFFEDVKNRVLESALLKFDPERNNSLGGYIIGSQFGIKNRIGDIVNRYKKLLSTSSIDIEAGETGAMHELASDEMADMAFEEVSEDAPKYKPISESNVVGPEVIESAKEKALRTVRTLKTKIAKPQLNVMVSPFVAEIRDEMGKQVDIDLKTAMGGKKDNQLRNWAINAKKAFLENMTTTFLMGKDGVGGVPQAIQKRINGEWVNYPDWVGKTPDRESVNEQNAGRTAGHHLVRRLPDVANQISDKVFLDQLLDETGNPIRGRKESWAQVMAQELTLELIAKDIKEQGPIYEALAKNQEMLGNAIGDSIVSDVIYQFERGSTKLSKSEVAEGKEEEFIKQPKLMDKARQELFNAYGKLPDENKANVLEYIHNPKVSLDDISKAIIGPSIDKINRLSRAQFSKSIDEQFNSIIEENKGVESSKRFDDIVAKRRGHEANSFQFYVPPSAADFELLLYNFMGKGKKGEEQAKFFSDTLLKPYSEGNDMMDEARQSIKNDYKKLNEAFPNVKAKLESLTPDKDFTYDQAVRVAMWKQEGVEIPGLSERDTNKLSDMVNNDPELKAFKERLIISGRQGKGWIAPEKNWDANTIVSDLHNLTEGEGRKKFLQEFIDNAEQMFGKWNEGKLVGPNMNKVEATYGTNVREALEDSIYRMTHGKNRSYGKDKETTAWSNWVNGSTGAIMFLNTRSAALQLLGSINFLNLRDNNPIAAAKAFADQPQYWSDFAHIWNSAKIKERRGGLKDDVAAAEIANAAATAKGSNKPKAVLSYLLKKGYAPTQIADSFAIAAGGAPFYRNRIKSYLKEGLSEKDAEHMAWNDFTKVSDETQQSGDPRDISKQQASGAGRLLLTFQNTAMQQSRIIKKSYLDLKNGRGDAKTHVAKIGYYLAVQNLMFQALQTGLFAVMFDDDKEKNKIDKTTEDKLYQVADGVLDTILRGTGFLGGTVATLKNMVQKYREEAPKEYKADYSKVVMEGLNISPPIGSKAQKLYSGLQELKYSKDLIKARGWDVMQNGRVHLSPMYTVAGNITEAVTNIPAERLVKKINNISEIFNSQNKAWQRVAVGMGWSPTSVGIKDSNEDLLIEAKAKSQRKAEGKIKSKESIAKRKDSIANLSPEEYLKYIEKNQSKKQDRKDSIANLPPEDYLDYLEKQKASHKGRIKESTEGHFLIK